MAMNQRSRLVVAGIEVFAEVSVGIVAVADTELEAVGIEAVDTAVSVLSLLVSKRSMK